MESFEEYLLQEYKDISYNVVNFQYSHNSAIKIDKKTKIPIKYNTIFVNIKFYNKKVNLIKSINIKFINNILAKVCEKKFVNISPSELNNKFMIARGEIIKVIYNNLAIKYNKIKSKINELNDYKGKANDSIAINDEFKGEYIDIVDIPKADKKSFDM